MKTQYNLPQKAKSSLVTSLLLRYIFFYNLRADNKHTRPQF